MRDLDGVGRGPGGWRGGGGGGRGSEIKRVGLRKLKGEKNVSKIMENIS